MTDRQGGRLAGEQRDRWTNIQIGRPAGRQTDRHRQTDRTGTQADRQTVRQVTARYFPGLMVYKELYLRSKDKKCRSIAQFPTIIRQISTLFAEVLHIFVEVSRIFVEVSRIFVEILRISVKVLHIFSPFWVPYL